LAFQNSEAEQMILSAILNGHVNYLDEMEIEDFSIPSNEAIFKAMLKLRDKNTPIDIVTIGTELQGTGLMRTVFEINEAYFKGDKFDTYKDIIKQNTFKRRLQRAILCIQEELKKDDVVSMKSNVLQFINDIPLPGNRQDDSIKTILLKTYEELEKAYNNKDDDSKQTGIVDLDNAMGGLHPDEVTILAARPAVGKTALGIQIMLNFARKGNKVILFSREMSQTRNAKRLISNQGNIDGQKIRTGKLKDEDWGKVVQACSELSNMDIYINDQAGTVPEIRAICREKQQKDGLDLIVIDYLQLLRNTNKHDTREREVAEMSRAIKEMNLEMKIPVILLSQLSRTAANKRPTLDTLRESGAIEQDADNVILLHKPTVDELNSQAEKDMYGEITSNGNEYIEVIIAKQRDGRTGMFAMQYVPKYLQFHSIYKGE